MIVIGDGRKSGTYKAYFRPVCAEILPLKQGKITAGLGNAAALKFTVTASGGYLSMLGSAGYAASPALFRSLK